MLTTLLLSLTVQATLLDTEWLHHSSQTIDGAVFCSSEKEQEARHHPGPGGFAVYEGNNGWFWLTINSGCGGWVPFPLWLQNLDGEVFDWRGKKVGTLTETTLLVRNAASHLRDGLIYELELKRTSSTTATMEVRFSVPNDYGYQDFEMSSKLTPWPN